MNYWADIKMRLKDPLLLGGQLLILISAAYIFIMAEQNRRWKVPILFIILISWFLFRNRRNQPVIWIGLTVFLLVDLYLDYFWLANHHFMLLFMVLSVLIYSYHKRDAILLKNVQMLLVIVVMTSVIQKVVSRQFMSGDFYYYMLNRGAVFKHFISFFPESVALAKSNSERIFELHATDPNNAKRIELNNIFPNLGQFSLIFAYVSVVIEFVVAIAILVKPRGFWTHLFLLVMILGILCTRFETGFMALLAICGVFLSNNIYLRLLYVLIFMGCLVLVITKLGFH